MAQALRILTFNVKLFSDVMKRGFDPAGFPPRMFYEKHGITDEKRTQIIAEVIAKRGYDIVCLQEVFDEDRRAQLSKTLRNAGYWVIAKATDGDLAHEDSGLFVAARHKMHERWYFNEYDSKADSDALADKGIVGCWIFLDAAKYGVGNLNLFNTHLQSNSDRAEIRASQLRQARRFVARYLKKAPHANTAALLCGDLNVVEESSEYPRMLGGFRTGADLLRAHRPDITRYLGYTWDATSNENMIASASRAQERLDYILGFKHVPPEDPNTPSPALACVNVVASEVEVFDTTANTRLSDHYALEMTVEFG